MNRRQFMLTLGAGAAMALNACSTAQDTPKPAPVAPVEPKSAAPKPAEPVTAKPAAPVAPAADSPKPVAAALPVFIDFYADW